MTAGDGPRLRRVALGPVALEVAEQGQGPLVVLVHGFPESWYSWRHQLDALARAGYRAVAPDMRGYGRSSAPPEVEAYDQVELAGDVARLIDALAPESGGREGEGQAVVIGHDWGAPVAWHTAMLHPEKVRAVGGLSVPWRPRASRPPLQTLRQIWGERFFYQLYFQSPGVAEGELEADIRRFLRIFFYLASGDAPPQPALMAKRRGDRLLEGLIDPETLPPWLSEQDLDHYEATFRASGLRGPLNWYRNLDRTWARTESLAGARITQPALFIAGEKDPVLRFWEDPLAPMREGVPDLRICALVPGAGHWIQQERPEAVNEAMLAFLGELDAGPGAAGPGDG